MLLQRVTRIVRRTTARPLMVAWVRVWAARVGVWLAGRRLSGLGVWCVCGCLQCRGLWLAWVREGVSLVLGVGGEWWLVGVEVHCPLTG